MSYHLRRHPTLTPLSPSHTVSVWLGLYSVAFFALGAQLLTRPACRAGALGGTLKGSVIFLGAGVCYTVLYIVFETVGRCLMFGDFFGVSCGSEEDPLVPKLVGLLFISIAGTYVRSRIQHWEAAFAEVDGGDMGALHAPLNDGAADVEAGTPKVDFAR